LTPEVIPENGTTINLLVGNSGKGKSLSFKGSLNILIMKDRPTEEIRAVNLPPVATAYNNKDRNAFILGRNPQAELWNGRLAMLGFLSYVLWDWKGYSVLRDVLNLMN
jgi:hypothetical protein